MTQARIELNDYTLKILDIVKAIHGLKNRSEAINKLIADIGTEYLQPEINPAILKELDKTHNKHIKKYGYISMKEKELNKILGL